MKFHLKYFSILVALAFVSCAGTQVNIPNDLSPAEIIQRAQEASERNRFNLALQYYEELLARFSFNIDLVCTAEYEIAFIYYKQRKFDEAIDGFNRLLERYQEPNGHLLPQSFRRLSEIVLARIEEEQNTRRRRLFS